MELSNLILEKVTFRARKMKKKARSERMSYISVNGMF